VSRLSDRFEALGRDKRPAFIPYVMAGDPDLETTARLLKALPGAGADVIELGFPFTDPMADGPTIQAAAERSLANGTRLDDVFALVRDFRAGDADTPVILMGYANPPHARGFEAFAGAMADSGADGAIIVDLPPEEDSEFRDALDSRGLSLIRLATPTTDDRRLPKVVEGVSGFVYYVAVAGVTGGKSGEAASVAAAVKRIRAAANLPVAVGFGVKTPDQAARTARDADAVVVGSAIVETLARDGADAALDLTRALADAVHSVGKQ